jgi:general L-amino acid transport system permease protein
MFSPLGRLASSLSQAALIGCVLFTLWFLASTAAENLRDLGIASGFGFLARESGFAIGETTLISHHAGDTYLRALLVGILNTFRVALLAILLATILGTFIGLARLSQNWLLEKLAGGYVEIARNTPLIVQLFFWYALLTENLPGPAEAWNLAPGMFISNRGLAFPFPNWSEPAWPTLAGAVLFGGLSLALAFFKASEAALAAARAIAAAAAGLLVVSFLDLEMPELSGFDFAGGASLSPEFTALLLGLSLYTAAFIGEILRAGILAVERGQVESGAALGLTRRQVMRWIVAPQALRLAVPPVTSQYLNCFKNSSLAVAIGYPDLVSIANTTINQTGQAIEGFAIIMLAYLTVSLAIAAAMNAYNRRVALRGAPS